MGIGAGSASLPALQTVTLCSALLMQASGIRLPFSSHMSFRFPCKRVLKEKRGGRGHRQLYALSQSCCMKRGVPKIVAALG